MVHMNPQNQSIFEDEIRGFESDHIMSNLVKKLKSEKRASNVHTLKRIQSQHLGSCWVVDKIL
jgi:hypothetical protein